MERQRYQILTSGLYASECALSSGHVGSKHRQQKAWLAEQPAVLALRLLPQITTDTDFLRSLGLEVQDQATSMVKL